MKKVLLFFLFLVSLKSFAQTNLSYHYQIPKQLNDGLQTTSLSEVGIDSNKIINLTNKIFSNTYINIHSLLILRHNKLVYENYFPGQDEIWAEPIGVVNHTIDSLHDARSISKSIVSACIGIAIAQGKIKNEDQNIWSFFPEYSNLNTGVKSKLTVKDLLTMTSGLDWKENVPYTDSTNTATLWDRSPDLIEFVLSRKSVDTPGTRWNYCGGNTQVLAAIIKKVSGLEVDEYARKYLFTPLGITNFSWTQFPSTPTRKSIPAAASGLRLSSRDMLKFGLLYINKGKWENKQIILPDWVERSLQFYFLVPADTKTYYGYQFWGGNVNVNDSMVDAFAAMGNGGQLIAIIPSLEVAVVVTAGNYNTDLSDQSYDMVANEIYRAIEIKRN